MRSFQAIAVLILGFAGVTAAGRRRCSARRLTHNVPHGQRVGPIVIYDYQPGVVVRAYWLSPWRNRHYFPFGAAQHQSDAAWTTGRCKPAEDFERSWSTAPGFIREFRVQPAGSSAAPMTSSAPANRDKQMSRMAAQDSPSPPSSSA